MNLFHRGLIAVPGFLLLALSLNAAESASGVDLKAMDSSANPCINFYQYACGAWREANPIPPDRSRWSRSNELSERNLTIERGILEKAAVPGAKRTGLEQKIGDYYAACMDEKAIETRGTQPIEPVLKTIRGLSSKADLVKAAAELHQSGVRGLGLPDRDYYLKTDSKSVELRAQYERHVRAMLELLAKSEGRPAADAGPQAQAVLRIETTLAKASLDRVVSGRDRTGNDEGQTCEDAA